MKWALVFLLAFGLYLPTQARADFVASGNNDEFAVEENIEQVFTDCLKDIKDKKRKRIELYTCMNLGLAKQKAEKAEQTTEPVTAPTE